MNDILDCLLVYGGVMLSSTSSGWCCHVVGNGINRHCHAPTAHAAAAMALAAMTEGKWFDDKPEAEE